MNPKIKVLIKILNLKDIFWFLLFVIPLIIFTKNQLIILNSLWIISISAIMLKFSDSLFLLFLRYNNNSKQIDPLYPLEILILATSFLISAITLSSFVGLTPLIASAFVLITNQVKRKKYNQECLCIPVANSLLPAIIYLMFLGIFPNFPFKLLLIVIFLIINNYLKYIQVNIKFENYLDYLKYRKIASVMYYLLIIMLIYQYKNASFTIIFFILSLLPLLVISILQFVKPENKLISLKVREIIYNFNNTLIILSLINEI